MGRTKKEKERRRAREKLRRNRRIGGKRIERGEDRRGMGGSK